MAGALGRDCFAAAAMKTPLGNEWRYIHTEVTWSLIAFILIGAFVGTALEYVFDW